MPRVLTAIVACLAVFGPAGVHAQSAGRIELDVLEADETPGEALKRMEEAARRANAEGGGRSDRPDLAPFIPDDSLGARGLLVPDPAGLNGLDHDPLRPILPDVDDVIDQHGDRDDEKEEDKDDDKGGGKDGKGGGKGGGGGKG